MRIDVPVAINWKFFSSGREHLHVSEYECNKSSVAQATVSLFGFSNGNIPPGVLTI